MSTIPTMLPPAQQTLTPDQQTALKRLHQASQQFEGVFLGMLFKEMRATVPTDSIFGKESPTESTFTEMLDQQRAQELASTGTVGIAAMMEQQMRAAVLANAGHESKSAVPEGFQP